MTNDEDIDYDCAASILQVGPGAINSFPSIKPGKLPKTVTLEFVMYLANKCDKPELDYSIYDICLHSDEFTHVANVHGKELADMVCRGLCKDHANPFISFGFTKVGSNEIIHYYDYMQYEYRDKVRGRTVKRSSDGLKVITPMDRYLGHKDPKYLERLMDIETELDWEAKTIKLFRDN